MAIVEQEATTGRAMVPKAVSVDNSSFSSLLDVARFEQLQRVAGLFAKSTLVPKTFQGSLPNCFIACQMAMRLGVDPLGFMQNSYVVGEKCGIETKLATALLNSSGQITGPLQYELTGSLADKTLACKVFCVDAATGKTVSHALSWDDVERNKWNEKSAWKNDPRLMIQYRAAMRLIRLHYSGVILGLYSKDELEDDRVIEGSVLNSSVPVSQIESKLMRGGELPMDDYAPSINPTATRDVILRDAKTIGDVEALRKEWSAVITDTNDLDEMDLACNLRIKQIQG